MQHPQPRQVTFLVIAAMSIQQLQERFGLDKRILAGLLSADEVKVYDALTAYNFVGQQHSQILQIIPSLGPIL